MLQKILLCLIMALCTVSTAQAKTTEFKIAHIKFDGNNMVIYHVGSNWFDQSLEIQELWYTSLQRCTRAANLAGTVLAVSNYQGRFKFYGPHSWHPFLRTIDMAWVNARKNKVMSCTF